MFTKYKKRASVTPDPDIISADGVQTDEINELSAQSTATSPAPYTPPFFDGLVNTSFESAIDVIPKIAETSNFAFTALQMCEAFHTCVVKVRYKPSYMRAKSSGRLLGGN